MFTTGSKTLLFIISNILNNTFNKIIPNTFPLVAILLHFLQIILTKLSHLLLQPLVQKPNSNKKKNSVLCFLVLTGVKPSCV